MYKQAIVNNLIKIAQDEPHWSINEINKARNAALRAQQETQEYKDLAQSVVDRHYAELMDADNVYSELREINNENARNATNNANVARSLANKGLKTFQYGGAGIGGAAGAGLGYVGSNWLSKKLGLKGGKGWRRAGDIALRTLGTIGGGAAGAYGGYNLGNYIGNNVFSTDKIKELQPNNDIYSYGDPNEISLFAPPNQEELKNMAEWGLTYNQPKQ